MHVLAEAAIRAPGRFAHWRFGLRPDGWAMGAWVPSGKFFWI